MFKYNELSDLLTGELVTPLRMDENDNIICLNKNNEEIVYTFDDFDFDKTPEERIFIVDDDTSNEEAEENQTTTEPSEPEGSDKEITEPEASETENNNEEITDPEQISEVPQNNEEEITEPVQEEPKPEESVQKKSGWIEDENEKAELLFSLGYNISSLKKINIYRDTVI
jgi:hypothetical protein